MKLPNPFEHESTGQKMSKRARQGGTVVRTGAEATAGLAKRVPLKPIAALAAARGVKRAREGEEGSEQQPQRSRLRAPVVAVVVGAGVGAAVMYFLDPKSGRRRRHVTRDRGTAMIRRPARKAKRAASTTATRAQNRASGAVAQAGQAVGGRHGEEPNDPMLVDRVETVLFRDKDVPKGDINVNAESGVIYLRGAVSDPALIARLVEQASHVDGVQRVESLLHAPGTPAPPKGD
jgi:gas vesicle protein